MPPNELNMDPTEIELKRNLLTTMLKKHCGYLKACVVPNQFRPVVKVNNLMTLKKSNITKPNLTNLTLNDLT